MEAAALGRILDKLDAIDRKLGAMDVAIARLDVHAEERAATLAEVKAALANKADRTEVEAIRSGIGRALWLAAGGFLAGIGSAVWKIIGGAP